MPVPQGVPKGESQCLQRVKMGFTIGFMGKLHALLLLTEIIYFPTEYNLFVLYQFVLIYLVGLGSGFLFGGFSSFRAGLRGLSLLTNTGKVMVQGGGTFGTFMAIGSAIRC